MPKDKKKHWKNYLGRALTALQSAFQAGSDTYRQRAELYHACMKMHPPEVFDVQWHQDLCVSDSPWFTNAAIRYCAMKEFVGDLPPKINPGDLLPPEMEESIVTTSVIEFAMSRWDRFGKCWFDVDDDLAYGLLATQPVGLLADEIALPLPCMTIVFPADVIHIFHSLTSWHEMRAVYITEGFASEDHVASVHMRRAAQSTGTNPFGRRLLFVCDTEPNENSSDGTDTPTTHWSLLFNDPTRTIEDLIVEQKKYDEAFMDYTDSKPWHDFHIRVFGEEVPCTTAFQIVERFVFNLLLFINSEQCVITMQEPSRLLLRGKKPGYNTSTALVRSSVDIDKRLKHVFRSGFTTGRKLTMRTVVRGHFRNQACGPHHSERKRIWIKPHIRGKDLATSLRGHDYNVKAVKPKKSKAAS